MVFSGSLGSFRVAAISRLFGLNTTSQSGHLKFWGVVLMSVCSSDRVVFCDFAPFGNRVSLASHTSRTITMRGKKALRKKRFTGCQGTGGLSSGGVCFPRVSSDALGHQIVVEHADVRQIAVSLGEIEAVADHEAVRDLEADVAHVHLDLAALGLRHERAHLQARRLARLEVPHEVREREARVDDVLDDEHVTVLDVDVEVLEDAHHARGVSGCSVARNGHEVDFARHRYRPHQVGHEEDRALEHADEQKLLAGVVGRDLGAQLADPRLERVLVDEDLPDRLLELGVAHALTASTPGASRMPGTATTSSPRTTSGQPSRSDRGTFASTNTS